MTSPTPQRRAAAPPTGHALLVALRVSRARQAARAGDHEGALRLLDEAEDPAVAEHPDVLDLRARLHAQRGELDRAADCWRRVQRQRPDDPAARAGLARLDRLNRPGPRAAIGRHRARTAAVAALSTVAAALAVGAALVPGAGGGSDDERSTVAGTAQPDQSELAERVEAEHRAEQARIAEREAGERAAAEREAAEALAGELAGPGLRVTVVGEAVEVAFTEVVFVEGDELTPTGAERLAALGASLAGHPGRVEVRGHAAAVPGAPDSGGSVLALWRALVAVGELSAASDRPLTDFTTVSADQREAPFATPALNRTVTVVITPDMP
ncbi:tetratricopeptide repeat protein [Streptomyces sp. 3MP-14]|uniref:Tetratricopeptide repeat protein n=1 Tax=Streptomyces mimosae TaxID=2586635 RepID=A0A5N5ZP15_9ACTN|nr:MULTISPECIES: tetratricopeptide repeat protein [Streptomyces]KAB8157446.1 tetratricopeptide repeat protein [Streptomyces mimosae]KAB8172270.1 tetratricopeptide repeat protein [Streptomyces sp. 3MP-14]